MSLRRMAATLVVMTWLSGCNTQAKWTYPMDLGHFFRSSAPPRDLSIAVLPFREERPVTNRSATVLLYMIPLMPFGWVQYERPEAARMFNTIVEYELQLDEDLAKAAVRSLEESGLFRRTFFTFGADLDEADYALRGTARSTRYNGRIISYGLSVFGPLLWFVGLPAGTSDNDLEIELVLEDSDGVPVWQFAFSESRGTTQGIYYNWGNDAINFSVLMQKAMNEALGGLAIFLEGLERAATEHGPTSP